ncbi:hypothetical protein HS088_TW06G01360 [Tripterygium wilfordii]|uniref:Uncharacterized protein n=1 Tax=Tripterygium wilfordii TaxID=458696 RepID=A0A7J7DLN3_TRIWF|nr:uncharacterized protein LOC119999877 [Tripterygium wilfordii]KAF5747179.1 hypothetical protein HS088_TW06G01360 [Tripterygium wilfordii]
MEQSTSDFYDFDEDERDVIGILLELPELIAKSENSPDWGFQRRRIAVPNGSTRPMVVEPQEPNVKAIQATTPVTPLSLSLSESDGNHECSKRSSSHNKKLRHYQPSMVDQTAHGQSPPVFHTLDLNVSPPPLEHSVQASPGGPYLAYIRFDGVLRNMGI